MSKGKYGNGDLEFTRAAMDEWRTSELSYRTKWEVELSPAGRGGIVIVEVRVYDLVGDRRAGPVVKTAQEWPNSTPQAFGAFLYSLCHKTARMVEMWALQDAAGRARVV